VERDVRQTSEKGERLYASAQTIGRAYGARGSEKLNNKKYKKRDTTKRIERGWPIHPEKNGKTATLGFGLGYYPRQTPPKNPPPHPAKEKPPKKQKKEKNTQEKPPPRTPNQNPPTPKSPQKRKKIKKPKTPPPTQSGKASDYSCDKHSLKKLYLSNNGEAGSEMGSSTTSVQSQLQS